MDKLSFFIAISFQLAFIRTIHGNHFENEPNCNQSLVFAINGQSHLMRYDMVTGSFHVLTPSTNLDNAIALAADQSEGLVFFTDVHLKQIYKKNFKDGTDAVLIKSLPTDSIADGIAVDHLDKTIFYSDYAEYRSSPLANPVFIYAYIRRMDYNGNNGVDILSASDGLHRPRAILVDTTQRKIYYTDWGDTPHISKVDYDGSNVQVLRNIGLMFPNGLAEDFANDRIFYCDAGTETIGVINTDGTGHTIIVQNDPVFHFFDIIRIHDELYLSNWENEASIFERTVVGVIKMNFDATSSSAVITIDGTGSIKVNGLVDICFPADGPTVPLENNDDTTITSTLPATTTTTTISTTTATTTTTTLTTIPVTTTATTATSTTSTVRGSSDPFSTTTANLDGNASNSSGGSNSNQSLMIIIGMSLLAGVVIITIVGVTLCCICIRRKNNKSTTGAQSTSQHINKSFDRPDYITPIAIDNQGQGKHPSAPPYISSQYLSKPAETESGVYEQLQIYDTIKN